MTIENHSKHFPQAFYRVSVKGLIIKDGKVLLMKESATLEGGYELPGGGLDFSEDIHTGLKREVEEEMGVKVKNISPQPIYVWTSKFHNRRDMDWYYSLVLAYRIEVESLDFKVNEECEGIDFFSKDEMQDIPMNTQTFGFREVFNPNDFDK